jgi:hypothetical protein
MPEILHPRKRNSQRINASHASGGLPELTPEEHARRQAEMIEAMGRRRYEAALRPSIRQRQGVRP